MMEEYINRLNVAQNHFDWAADSEEVDIAIFEMNAAELALSHYVKKRKEES